MIADRRIKALATCVSRDKWRPALQHVHIKGDMAEATDGHILARAHFTEFPDEDYPGDPGGVESADGALVEPEAIIRAFRDIPKKTCLPVSRCIHIGRVNDTVVVSHLLPNLARVEERYKKEEEVFPDAERVIPKDRAEIRVDVDAQYLEKLTMLARAADRNYPCRISLYIAADQATANTGAIRFEIKDCGEVKIDGLVMPLRITD